MSAFIRVVFVILFTIIPINQAIALDTPNCNYKMLSNQINIDITKLTSIEKPSLEESTEGGLVTEYWNKDKLKKITVDYFGETGKSEISYYPKDGNYFVNLKNTYYTSPIYDKSSDVASVSEFKFIICNEKNPNYPNSSELNTEYNRAIYILKNIK
ncbi:hypothetical protein [Photobacterium nomapromontoriensis]|uniref:hypothetical protein n=1 Tax=Photobacterium nomapromontoriensis TaxID=2910237 RepID=UPI003D097AD8